MIRYAAFLRAINVGGRVVKMDRLRRIFESLGVSSVETFIASGNVVFDSPSRSAGALEKKIAEGLEAALGYEVATFLRTTAELSAVAKQRPFPEKDLARATLYIGFVSRPLEPSARRKVLAMRTDTDDLDTRGREVFWLCRGARWSDAGFSPARLEKALGLPATFRNITTVRRMAARFSS